MTSKLPWRGAVALVLLTAPWLLLLSYGIEQLTQQTQFLSPWLNYPGLAEMIEQTVVVGITVMLVATIVVLSSQPLRSSSGWLVQVIALPHLAFAIGLLWLFAPYGWLWRLVPEAWHSSVFDRQQLLSFIIILLAKEIPFLWLMSQRTLAQMPWRRWLLVGQSLGYSRQRSWWLLVMPELLRRMRLPLMIVLVYSLSVVDVALIAAAQTPPPLAVQVLQWQLDAQPASQQFAAYGALTLLLLAVVAALTVFLQERLIRAVVLPHLGNFALRVPWQALVSVIGLAAAFAIAAQSIAVGWFYPELWPTSWSVERWQQELSQLLPLFVQSAGIAAVVASASLIWVVLLLEWRRRHGVFGLSGWLLLPLLVPQLTLLLAWQELFAAFTSGGLPWRYALALIMVQIPFSAAYVYLILAPLEQRFEQRYLTTMQSFGYGFWRSWWLTKRSLLQQPLLLAWVFAALVSMAQYLPIVLFGGGRWPTLTSELVAVSSGANSQLIAIYAVSQWLLALLFLLVLAWPQQAVEGEQQ
ncbi:MAG: Inner membrane ABC transporter permease protein YnjC [Pseudidiomarina mangrovi]|nr:MAG: Inner membrane ABC transporter permease protein YnjC [Pseudidiomarina mangrovi]